jgi:hypothetical protein
MLAIYCAFIIIFVSIYAFTTQFICSYYKKQITFIDGVLGVTIISMLSGLASLFLPKWISILVLLIPIFWSMKIVFTNRRTKDYNLKQIFKTIHVDKAGFVAWFIVVSISCFLTLIPLSKQENLPDGAYVYKNWIAPVANQWASGDLPADNSLPYFTAEFLIRDLPVDEVHPIMPGQEIVNRTFGVPLIYLSLRQFFSYDSNRIEVPSFDYVNTSWPNVTVLYNKDSYVLYNAVSIVLNGFLVFVIFFILGRRSTLFGNGYPAAVLLGIFPFLVHQTFYTWTKSFCIALSLMAIYNYLNSRKLLGGAFAAAAFHVHPMAVIFIAATIVFEIMRSRKISLKFVSIPAASIVLWQFWISTTGLKSDLLQQNLFINQTLLDHLSARIVSVGVLLNPGALSVYPFNLRDFTTAWNLAGVLLSLGFLLVIYISQSNVMARNELENNILKISLITVLLTSMSFSKPVPLQFFGGQILIATLLIILLPRVSKIFQFLVIFTCSSLLLFLWTNQLITV